MCLFRIIFLDTVQYDPRTFMRRTLSLLRLCRHRRLFLKMFLGAKLFLFIRLLMLSLLGLRHGEVFFFLSLFFE